jgi:hypothetical protein
MPQLGKIAAAAAWPMPDTGLDVMAAAGNAFEMTIEPLD